MTSQPSTITSRDNPLMQRLRKLLGDGGAYRKQGEVWLEGDHLMRAALDRGQTLQQAVIAESAMLDPALRGLAHRARQFTVVSDALFASLSELGSPGRIGALVGVPVPAAKPNPGRTAVVLDRLQDPGNVGSILRSASALGVRQVLALKGTVALWSPKVLRAGMGAHFALDLFEGLQPQDVTELGLALVATSSHAEHDLITAPLPAPCAWVLGHEGQGVQADLLAACQHQVRIPQPGGEESLNVAAAAAVCFYESARRAFTAQ